MLLLSTASGPTVTAISPDATTVENTGLSSFIFGITGDNLPSGATVTLEDGADTLTTTIDGSDEPEQLRRQVSLPADTRSWDLVINGSGLTIRLEDALTVTD
jgi:hypothetical protein